MKENISQPWKYIFDDFTRHFEDCIVASKTQEHSIFPKRKHLCHCMAPKSLPGSHFVDQAFCNDCARIMDIGARHRFANLGAYHIRQAIQKWLSARPKEITTLISDEKGAEEHDRVHALSEDRMLVRECLL